MSERGTPGEIIGYTYLTNISAFVNGNIIGCEIIDGKIAVTVEDLCGNMPEEVPFVNAIWLDDFHDFFVVEDLNTGRLKLTSYAQYCWLETPCHVYFMSCEYSDEERILRLYTTRTDEPSSDERLAELRSILDKNKNAEIIQEHRCSDGNLFLISQEVENGNEQKPVVHLIKFCYDGRVLYYYFILHKYDFLSHYSISDRRVLSITDGKISEDGKFFTFYGERFEVINQNYELVEDFYILDLSTCIIKKKN